MWEGKRWAGMVGTLYFGVACLVGCVVVFAISRSVSGARLMISVAIVLLCGVAMVGSLVLAQRS
jgi:hypothetical protein